MMYLMHHAFRRDLGAFRSAAVTADLGDRPRWEALRRRWDLFCTFLHHHHSAEDAGLWPLLFERVSDDESRQVLGSMEAEHASIDPMLETCTRAFTALADSADASAHAELQRSLDATHELLSQHLDHEERDAMALVQRHLSPEEWRDIEHEHFRPAYSARDLLSAVPWAMSGLPQDVRRALLVRIGQPMGLLWHATRKRFDRAEVRVFGTHVARSTDTRLPVAVVGATGTVGAHVVDELVSRHADVRVLVRHPRPQGTFAEGVTQVVADLRDESSLRRALADVRSVLYVSPHESDELDLATNFISAAEATGTRVVFAGVHLSARTIAGLLTRAFLPSYRAKLRIGQRISESRTDPVIFSPTNFFQNDEVFEGDIRGGRFPEPMRGVNRVDVRDLAELCAIALLDPGHPGGEHVVAGPASLSGAECAEIWSSALGRSVVYVGDDEQVWRPIFEQRLSGQKLADWLDTARFLGRRSVELPKDVAATTALLGRVPRRYADYVAELAGRAPLEPVGRRSIGSSA